jgi:hypothetical protein
LLFYSLSRISFIVLGSRGDALGEPRPSDV